MSQREVGSDSTRSYFTGGMQSSSVCALCFLVHSFLTPHGSGDPKMCGVCISPVVCWCVQQHHSGKGAQPTSLHDAQRLLCFEVADKILAFSPILSWPAQAASGRVCRA